MKLHDHEQELRFLTPDGSSPPPPSRPPRPLTVPMVAERLGCDETTVRRLIRKGAFPNAHPLSRIAKSHWRIPPGDVEAHCTAMRVPAAPAVPAAPENPPADPRRALAVARKRRTMVRG